MNAENVKMLEQKIEGLTKAVENMATVMGRLNDSIVRLSSGLPVDSPRDDADPVENEVEQADPEPVAPRANKKEATTVSREDVQDLCMSIVREDRSKQAQIKAAIAAYDGAKTLKGVAEQNLAALKADLEKI